MTKNYLLKCDVCGWNCEEEVYKGSGECFNCFEGLMRSTLQSGEEEK